jgi:hypothetical protein
MCINDMTMKIMSEGLSVGSQGHNFISHIPMTVWRDDGHLCALDPIRLHPINVRWVMTF